MKKCLSCSMDVADEVNFCTNCGSNQFATDEGATTVLTPEAQQAYYAQFNEQQNANQQVYQTADVQQQYAQQQYAQQPMYQAPALKLSTNRSFLKTFLLSFVTFGIYPLVAYSKVSTDINTIASKYDGKKTMHYCLMAFVFSWLTLFIYPIVWMHKLSERIGDELVRRNIDYKFNASTFWILGFLLSFTLVGPIVYTSKLFRAMNKLSESYNMYG